MRIAEQFYQIARHTIAITCRRQIPGLLLAVCSIMIMDASYLQAQSYSFVHYDTKDGLPTTTVYDVTQDAAGFIWFGTENGLSRFDGKNFKNFTTKDGLADNSIVKVQGDNSGRVYFAPFTHGLHYYYKDSFYKVPIPSKYKPDISFLDFFISPKGKMAVAGDNNAYLFENNRLISMHDKYIELPDKVNICRVLDTLNIVFTADSIYFIPDSGTISAAPVNLTTGLIFSEISPRKGTPVKGKAALGGYLRGNLYFRYLGNLVEILDDRTGNVLYKIKVEKFSKAYIDNENNLWITTLTNGVYRIPSFHFKQLKPSPQPEIYSLLYYNKQVLAGADFSKLYTLRNNHNTGLFAATTLEQYTKGSGNTVTASTNTNRLYVLRSDEKGIYIGADAFLLRKRGPSITANGKIFPIKDIDIADNKTLVCTGRCVLLLNEEDMSIADTLLRQRATCGIIYGGNYYIGTIGGLVKTDPITKKTTELYNLFPPFHSRIASLKRGLNDDLWVATSGSGLIRFKDGNIVQVIREEDGLTSNICTSLFVDSNVIWLGTNKGLNRIETGKEKPVITRLTSSNGLGADYINAVIVADSNVYVGTAAGIDIFSKNILTEKSVCILHILRTSAGNKILKKDSSYSFPHNILNIRVDFTAISFKSAGDITYYYRLEGLEEKWNTTTANFINYPTLQPGHYTLYLKAINKFGVESDIKTISITIQPPWWQTLPFRIIVLVTVALLVFGIYLYNIRAIKRKEKTKREIEARFAALEQKALQAQMNPHFIFNALNSIQTFILDFDAVGANTYLTSFASLIRQTLDNSASPLITLAGEIKYLETYLGLEKLRFRDKFRYEIHADEDIDQHNTVLPGMLLQPYVENALRHGIQHRNDNNGVISLRITLMADGSILYSIADNGVGRKKAAELKSSSHIEYQSRGTSINEKRIAAINNQFTINIRVNTDDVMDKSGMVTGTVVTVLIPPFPKH